MQGAGDLGTEEADHGRWNLKDRESKSMIRRREEEGVDDFGRKGETEVIE